MLDTKSIVKNRYFTNFEKRVNFVRSQLREVPKFVPNKVRQNNYQFHEKNKSKRPSNITTSHNN